VLGLVLGTGRGASEVGLEEEAHEENGQGRKVDQVEVDGESLSGSVDARNRLVLSAVDNPVHFLVRVMEEVLNGMFRTLSSSQCLLLLVVWQRLAWDSDVLGETFITSRAVDELPKER
jgi:hypothetical protein